MYNQRAACDSFLTNTSYGSWWKCERGIEKITGVVQPSECLPMHIPQINPMGMYGCAYKVIGSIKIPARPSKCQQMHISQIPPQGVPGIACEVIGRSMIPALLIGFWCTDITWILRPGGAGGVSKDFARSTTPVSLLVCRRRMLNRLILQSQLGCDSGFRAVKEACVALVVPENSYLNTYGTGWEFNRPYRKRGDKCVQP